MCIILDANCFSDFKDHVNEDLKPVRNWVYARGGKIAYSPTARIESEWQKGGMEIFRDLSRANCLKEVPEVEVLKKQEELEGKLESNDAHILALAIISKSRVLVVQHQPNEPLKGGRRRAIGADTDLQKDFKRLTQGKVYVTSKHKRLLTRDLCP